MTNLPLNGDASTRQTTSAVPANEIKVRARLLLNALRRQEAGAIELARSVSASRRWAEPAEWTLTHCMNIASARAGFQHWDHARRVLGGVAPDGDDAGTLWYDNACEALTNQWFAHYAEARAIHDASSSLYLLPYRRQFIVVDRHFIELLGLDASDPAWTEAGRDLVSGYGSPAWRELAMRRLRAMRR
ncbi:hypothetical protein [Pseudoduganella sp. GCM10020061]|uniref:hypothetical protein n=1 Tax=Pseudoduganella sp. GCM10020061 TaxID=3317345 RepID=UPI003637B42B